MREPSLRQELRVADPEVTPVGKGRARKEGFKPGMFVKADAHGEYGYSGLGIILSLNARSVVLMSMRDRHDYRHETPKMTLLPLEHTALTRWTFSDIELRDNDEGLHDEDILFGLVLMLPMNDGEIERFRHKLEFGYLYHFDQHGVGDEGTCWQYLATASVNPAVREIAIERMGKDKDE